eukprot:9533-Rhodomonas_salina.1
MLAWADSGVDLERRDVLSSCDLVHSGVNSLSAGHLRAKDEDDRVDITSLKLSAMAWSKVVVRSRARPLTLPHSLKFSERVSPHSLKLLADVLPPPISKEAMPSRYNTQGSWNAAWYAADSMIRSSRSPRVRDLGTTEDGVRFWS